MPVERGAPPPSGRASTATPGSTAPVASVTRPATDPAPVSWARTTPAPLDSSVPSSTHVTPRSSHRRLRARRRRAGALTHIGRPRSLRDGARPVVRRGWDQARRESGGGRGAGRTGWKRRSAAVLRRRATHSPGSGAGTGEERGRPEKRQAEVGDAAVAVIEGRGEGRGRVAPVRRPTGGRAGSTACVARAPRGRLGSAGARQARVHVRVCVRMRVRVRAGPRRRHVPGPWERRPRARGRGRAPRRRRGRTAIVRPSASCVWSFRWWARCHTGPRIPPPTKTTSWTTAARTSGRESLTGPAV